MSQTNGLRGARVELNDRPYLLRFDFNAICELERETGVAYHELDPNKMTHVRAGIWAGLLHLNANIKLITVGEWLTPCLRDQEQFNSTRSAMFDALLAAFPQPSPEEQEKKALMPTGTGTNSSPTPRESDSSLVSSGR